MKILMMVLAVACLPSIQADEELANRAAEQLNRLSAFKRTKEPLVQDKNEEFGDKNTEDFLMNTETMKRIDELAQAAYNLYKDPNNEAIIQRIKRSGSGDFISGIANKVVGGVVGAVGGLSSGSSGGSGGAHDSYGAPVAPYGAKQFSIFDFKKAILNTVLQALKALAGGALALKGQLIKGGGFVVQTKGRVISSAGEAIASLGSQIASSAVISAPKPVYGVPGYTYETQHTQDVSYDGPPPSPDATFTEHNTYHHGSPSSDAPVEGPGLLIVKETKPDSHPSVQTHHATLQTTIADEHNHILDQHTDISQGTLEESFGGPTKSGKFTGVVSGTFQSIQSPNINDNFYLEHKEQVQPVQHNSPQTEYKPPIATQQFQDIPPFNPHLPSNDQNINYQNQGLHAAGNYQADYGFPSQSEPVKVSIFDHHNTLDAVNLGVVGLPNTYAGNLHEMEANYGGWKRIGTFSGRKKGTYWRYRPNQPKIYRI